MKIKQLRKLDANVQNTAVAVSLILGFGMSCVMVWTGKMFMTGIIIGIILNTAAYLIYKKS